MAEDINNLNISQSDNKWVDESKVKPEHLMGSMRLFERIFLGDFLSEFMKEVSNIIKKDDVLLDIGAGSGYFSLKIAKKFNVKKIICLDESKIMLDFLENEAKKSEVIDKIDILNIEASALKMQSNSIDLAFSNFVLHELQNPKMLVKKVIDVLKPGAWFIATDFRNGLFGNLIGRHHSGNAHGPFSPESLKNLFKSVDLTEIKVKKIRQCIIGVGRKI